MSQQWGPIRDLVILQDRMNRLFEDATDRHARIATEPRDEIERADWVPAADVYEHDQEYVLALDLPGMERSALEIDLDNDTLSIRGNRATEKQTLHRAERPRGKFARTFGIPAMVEQERIAAEYKDGVLYVHLPKHKQQKAPRVEIKVS